MRGIHFFTKKLAYESGVIVSLNHLCNILVRLGIMFQLDFYENDEELMEMAFRSPFDE